MDTFPLTSSTNVKSMRGSMPLKATEQSHFKLRMLTPTLRTARAAVVASASPHAAHCEGAGKDAVT
jgi:hypothetical protein